MKRLTAINWLLFELEQLEHDYNWSNGIQMSDKSFLRKRKQVIQKAKDLMKRQIANTFDMAQSLKWDIEGEKYFKDHYEK